jgi:hypothetical protein
LFYRQTIREGYFKFHPKQKYKTNFYLGFYKFLVKIFQADNRSTSLGILLKQLLLFFFHFIAFIFFIVPLAHNAKTDKKQRNLKPQALFSVWTQLLPKTKNND